VDVRGCELGPGRHFKFRGGSAQSTMSLCEGPGLTRPERPTVRHRARRDVERRGVDFSAR
jgi:hypothetical protein